VKSHGSSDALGFATAVGVAVDMAQYGFIASMKREFEKNAEAARVSAASPIEPPKQAAAG